MWTGAHYLVLCALVFSMYMTMTIIPTLWGFPWQLDDTLYMVKHALPLWSLLLVFVKQEVSVSPWQDNKAGQELCYQRGSEDTTNFFSLQWGSGQLEATWPQPAQKWERRGRNYSVLMWTIGGMDKFKMIGFSISMISAWIFLLITAGKEWKAPNIFNSKYFLSLYSLN